MKREERDEVILAALLCNQTTKAAAAACGIGETQIYARLRDPAFKKRYDTARLEMLDETTATLQKHLLDAVGEMAAIMHSAKTPPQVKLNACEAIIRSSLKLTDQVEILKRVERLEALNEETEDSL